MQGLVVKLAEKNKKERKEIDSFVYPSKKL